MLRQVLTEGELTELGLNGSDGEELFSPRTALPVKSFMRIRLFGLLELVTFWSVTLALAWRFAKNDQLSPSFTSHCAFGCLMIFFAVAETALALNLARNTCCGWDIFGLFVGLSGRVSVYMDILFVTLTSKINPILFYLSASLFLLGIVIVQLASQCRTLASLYSRRDRYAPDTPGRLCKIYALSRLLEDLRLVCQRYFSAKVNQTSERFAPPPTSREIVTSGENGDPMMMIAMTADNTGAAGDAITAPHAVVTASSTPPTNDESLLRDDSSTRDQLLIDRYRRRQRRPGPASANHARIYSISYCVSIFAARVRMSVHSVPINVGSFLSRLLAGLRRCFNCRRVTGGGGSGSSFSSSSVSRVHQLWPVGGAAPSSGLPISGDGTAAHMAAAQRMGQLAAGRGVILGGDDAAATVRTSTATPPLAASELANELLPVDGHVGLDLLQKPEALTSPTKRCDQIRVPPLVLREKRRDASSDVPLRGIQETSNTVADGGGSSSSSVIDDYATNGISLVEQSDPSCLTSPPAHAAVDSGVVVSTRTLSPLPGCVRAPVGGLQPSTAAGAAYPSDRGCWSYAEAERRLATHHRLGRIEVGPVKVLQLANLTHYLDLLYLESVIGRKYLHNDSVEAHEFAAALVAVSRCFCEDVLQLVLKVYVLASIGVTPFVLVSLIFSCVQPFLLCIFNTADQAVWDDIMSLE